MFSVRRLWLVDDAPMLCAQVFEVVWNVRPRRSRAVCGVVICRGVVCGGSRDVVDEQLRLASDGRDDVDRSATSTLTATDLLTKSPCGAHVRLPTTATVSTILKDCLST